MMATILNAAISDSVILHKKDFTNSFSLILMMEATKKLHSFILTHLDDGSHLEFCAILDSAILVFLSNSLTLAKIGFHHLPQKT